MKTIIAIESLIKDYEEKIKFHKKQLADHESGENRLTLVVQASTEENIIKLGLLLDKNKKLLVDLKNTQRENQERKKKIATLIEKSKKYENNIEINEKEIFLTDKQLYLNEIYDEIYPSSKLKIDEISTLIYKSMENYCEIGSEFRVTLEDIIKDFDKLTKGKTKTDILDFEDIKFRIIVFIGKLSVLHDSIINSIIQKDEIEEDQQDKITITLPKYHGWWIENLYKNYKAYLKLLNWIESIKNKAITDEQKDGWDALLIEWLYIQQTLSIKENNTFKLRFIFDTLVEKYGKIYEEMDQDIIKKL